MVIFTLFFGLAASLYSLFSYSLTSPNLVLTAWPPYWQFQTWMWTTFFNNRPLLTQTYLGLILGWWLMYFIWLWWSRQQHLTLRQLTLPVLASLLPLLLANNALSYDVFNYIFNAKMVVVYHADPHIKFALEYADDDWTRFMNNTHTPAPYGYGWTALSLLPYLLGGGKFTLTWTIFRVFSALSYLVMGGVLAWGIRRLHTGRDAEWSWRWLSWLALNPLILIEVISNAHNDLWMLAPATASLLLVGKPQQRRWQWWLLPLSLLLLAISISLKLVTIVLLPLWLVLVAWHFSRRFVWPWPWSRYHWLSRTRRELLNLLSNWPLVASLLLFVPLLTPRSQQFHPWYLCWILVWLPLFKWTNSRWQWWGVLAVSLSFTSLIRYVPYLWAGNHSPQILFHQQLITWSALGVVILWWIATRVKKLF